MIATTKRFIREGIVKGFFWAIGVTLGFAFVSLVVVTVLSRAGGLPIIGDLIANIVEATQSSLSTRTPIAPK